MAETEKKGLVARWLEGKERSEEYARSTLPTSRWALFWDILKGRFGKLVLVNLLVLVTCLPIVAILVGRYLVVGVSNLSGFFGGAFGVGMPSSYPGGIVGEAQLALLNYDMLFFVLFIPAGWIAALGISGGMYIVRNLIWTEGIFVANDFLRGIKRNYVNVFEAVTLFTVILFLARTMGNLADWYVALGAPSAGWLVASKVVGYILVAFSLLVCLWMISLGVNYRQGPWALFRNAVVMTIGTFPQTVLFAAAATWPFFLAVFGGLNFIGVIGILILVFIGFSYAFLVWMDYSQWAFDRYVNPTLGVATGRGLYNKDKQENDSAATSAPSASDSAAMREYKRLIIAQGRSKLISRPIKPIDDDMEVYQLPESFSRDDLKKLRESKEAIEQDVKQYEEAHKNDERYVEYNRTFDERERALREDEAGGKRKKKKKAPKPPKLLNKQ